MGRVSQTRKKSVSKTAGKSKKEKVEDVDLDNKSGDESSHDEQEEENEEAPKSSFMKECEHAFGTNDFYAVLHLEKDKATANDSR